MKLTHFKFTEHCGEPIEWNLEEVSFKNINLLVARNSTGKSRIVNGIAFLAMMLSGRKKPLKDQLSNFYFDVKFEDDADRYHYTVEHDAFEFTKEELHKNDENLLHRGAGGSGKIHAADFERMIRFQTRGSELAVVAKRDAIQHPFLEPLNAWGATVRHLEFGKSMGHGTLAVEMRIADDNFEETDANQIVRLFDKGKKKFEASFISSIKADMKTLGYSIDDISIRRPAKLILAQAPLAVQDVVGISLKETELACHTDHVFISQGMFRALSVIIQLNYSIMAKSATTILIDDIGEGLDYERSCLLIGLLRERALESSIQLIMSTNDRFVMNSVPLEEWNVLRRTGSTVRVYNYETSAHVFERFKKTGLANFDFLTTDYIEKAT